MGTQGGVRETTFTWEFRQQKWKSQPHLLEPWISIPLPTPQELSEKQREHFPDWQSACHLQSCRPAHGCCTGGDEEEMASADLSSETSRPQGHAAPHPAGVRTAQHPRAPVSLPLRKEGQQMWARPPPLLSGSLPLSSPGPAPPSSTH